MYLDNWKKDIESLACLLGCEKNIAGKIIDQCQPWPGFL